MGEVISLSSKKIQVDSREKKADPMMDYVEGISMNNDYNNSFDRKDLELVEQRLTNKIDVSEAKLSGKIDTVEAKLSGRMNVLDTKLNSLDDKIATQTKRMDWLIALVIGSILVPIFIKLFFK